MTDRRCLLLPNADAWSLETSWASGVVFVIRNVIVPGGAPIFNKLVGQRIDKLPRYYVTELLEACPQVHQTDSVGC